MRESPVISVIESSTFYPRLRFLTARVESAPLPRARTPRPLPPLPRPPLAVFAEGGAEGERKEEKISTREAGKRYR